VAVWKSFVSLCFHFAIIGIASPASAIVQKKGKLTFQSQIYDFGQVHRGVTLSHDFEFVNEGNGPTTIHGVHAACGCTAAVIDKGKIYQPKESGRINIKLDTTDFVGRVVKTVTVMTSDSTMADRMLTIKAEVQSEFEANPPMIDFGETLSTDTPSQIIRINPIDHFPLTISKVKYDQSKMDVGYGKDGENWIVTIRLRDTLAPGFLKETIHIKTNSKHLHDLPIPVRATVNGPIAFSPDYLEFGAISRKDHSRRSVTLSSNANFDVKGFKTRLLINGRKIDDASPYISIDTINHEKGKKLVAVELKNMSNLQGSVHGKLLLETDNQRQRELQLDFYAFFR
jgi:hypothetical protein